MPHKFYWIDAFGGDKYSGNPAGVCLLTEAAPVARMQALAAELNLAETAFVVATGDGSYNLRWFTPVCEVDLCGHATIAAARAVWDATGASTNPLQFATRSGQLLAQRATLGIRITLPADEPVALESDEIRHALGAHLLWLGLSRVGVIAEFASTAAVREFEPPLAQMTQWPGVLLAVTSAESNEGVDCVSRVFAPKIGINEDPATGAAHCALGPFWARRLKRPTLAAQQASSRGGELTIEVEGAQVHLTGRTHIIFKGECYA